MSKANKLDNFSGSFAALWVQEIICVYVHACVRVCVCVCERERDREGQRQRHREIERQEGKGQRRENHGISNQIVSTIFSPLN